MTLKNDAYILTYSSQKFYLFDKTKMPISIVDIAHHLSNLCRFSGASSHHYSVAQHSVLVSELVAALGGGEQEVCCGLVHDAAEAFTGDVPRPLKEFLPDYQEVEDTILRRILGYFGLPWPLPEIVHQADKLACILEAHRLGLDINKLDALLSPEDRWEALADWVDLRPEELWYPTVAKARFLQRYQVLYPQSTGSPVG